jgi:hypothetical protein
MFERPAICWCPNLQVQHHPLVCTLRLAHLVLQLQPLRTLRLCCRDDGGNVLQDRQYTHSTTRHGEHQLKPQKYIPGTVKQ